jgi:DNA modification methylase
VTTLPKDIVDVLTGHARFGVMRGHVLEQLRLLPDASVQCICFSPPYFGLRDYKTEPTIWGGNWRGELGSEPTSELFVSHLVEVMRELWRVLRPDGTVWLNINDSYGGSGKGPTGHNGIGVQAKRQGFTDKLSPGRAKSMHLIPERLKIALYDDGWVIRSTIVWAKTAPMPESVRDRPSQSWESVILLSKSDRYYFDQEALRDPFTSNWDLVTNNPGVLKGQTKYSRNDALGGPHRGFRNGANPSGRQGRNVWHIGPNPSNYAYCVYCNRIYQKMTLKLIIKTLACDIATRSEIIIRLCASCYRSDGWVDHFSVFPPEIPRRAIMAGTSDYGACVECGAPWRRVVKHTKLSDLKVRYAAGEPSKHNARIAIGLRSNKSGLNGSNSHNESTPGSPITTTTGWEPTCTHRNAGVRPCVVLDPFVGTGTTILEADQLGRAGIGIELNERYAKLTLARLHSETPW